MTLALAWIRKVKKIEELVIASDSRLRWGQAWDACPKLFKTAREDTVLGFAGDTKYSYPLILQASNHISLHRASLNRALDIHDLKGHLERVFNRMLSDLSDFPVALRPMRCPSLFLSWQVILGAIDNLLFGKYDMTKTQKSLYGAPVVDSDPPGDQISWILDIPR